MHRTGEARAEGGLPGLRLMDDILATDIDDYYELWRTAEVGQLDREMALQAYLMARANAEKFQAVQRVFQRSAAARRPDRAARRDHRPARHGADDAGNLTPLKTQKAKLTQRLHGTLRVEGRTVTLPSV